MPAHSAKPPILHFRPNDGSKPRTHILARVGSKGLTSLQRPNDGSSRISRLPERERRILCLHSQRELTLKQIALLMDVDESRVSQFHSAALIRLKARVDSLEIGISSISLHWYRWAKARECHMGRRSFGNCRFPTHVHFLFAAGSWTECLPHRSCWLLP